MSLENKLQNLNNPGMGGEKITSIQTLRFFSALAVS